MKLTELEKQMIRDIKADYEKHGHENDTEFYNLYGCSLKNEELRKQLRGTFTSLKRKKIVYHYNDPGCFNPIFRGPKWEEAIKLL